MSHKAGVFKAGPVLHKLNWHTPKPWYFVDHSAYQISLFRVDAVFASNVRLSIHFFVEYICIVCEFLHMCIVGMVRKGLLYNCVIDIGLPLARI